MVELTITFSIGAIIGWIIREIVSDRLARDRALEVIKITDFNKAAAMFRSAFTEESRELRSIVHADKIDRDFVYNLIGKSIVKHEIAHIRFEPYIDIGDIPAYSMAWGKYSNPGEYPKDQNPDPLLDYYAEGKSIKDCIHLAISNIENLLEFAKHK